MTDASAPAGRPASAAVGWKKLLVATHRDLGYLCAGLTLVYAISGVAVNHVKDWNPSYDLDISTVELGALPELAPEELAAAVLQRMAISDPIRSAVRMSPAELRVFLANRTLTVTLPAGTVRDERVTPRPVLFEMNYLHLNHGKGAWTLIADLYAVSLAVLAGTGIFIVRGKKGLGGRGRWLLLTGIALPLLYLLL